MFTLLSFMIHGKTRDFFFFIFFIKKKYFKIFYNFLSASRRLKYAITWLLVHYTVVLVYWFFKNIFNISHIITVFPLLFRCEKSAAFASRVKTSKCPIRASSGNPLDQISTMGEQSMKMVYVNVDYHCMHILTGMNSHHQGSPHYFIAARELQVGHHWPTVYRYEIPKFTNGT